LSFAGALLAKVAPMHMAAMMNFFTASAVNQLNRGKLMAFLDGKASILFLLASSTLAPVVQAAGSTSCQFGGTFDLALGTSQSLQRAELLDGWPRGFCQIGLLSVSVSQT
jgi:hypothetical protein